MSADTQTAKRAVLTPRNTQLEGLFDDGVAETLSSGNFSLDMGDYLPIKDMETAYLHGDENWRMFDFYGPVFIGIFLFVFTFITSGMSLVTERMGGTMTRFLATPVNAGQILGGYTLAFGLLACIQSAIILWVSLTFIGFPNEGDVGLVVFTCITMAMVSVALGLMVSGLASTPFQVIQLILLFVVPQILLCGLFDLADAPAWLAALSNAHDLRGRRPAGRHAARRRPRLHRIRSRHTVGLPRLVLHPGRHRLPQETGTPIV